MQFLPGERIISEIADRTLRLTSHRIRYQTRISGNDRVVSFMLEDVTSCGLVGESLPWLLLAAAICGVAALVEQGDVRIGLLVIAAILVGGYFATRRHILAVRSAGHAIQLRMAGMTTAQVMEFIEATELAKNERYLLHVPLGVPAPGYTPIGNRDSFAPPR